MLYKREIQKHIEDKLFQKKIIVIYGPRQVGKTTLLKMIEKNHSDKKSLFLDCDDFNTREILSDTTSTDLKKIFQNYEVIFIDEAQRIENIGLTLKIAIDNIPEKQFIVTGSSSFDLSNKINEPLTGRKYEFNLFSLSLAEISSELSFFEKDRLFNDWLTYGTYPDIVNNTADAQFVLKNLIQGTLYKDVLEHQNVRNSKLLGKLLQALAYQIGQEVSYNELASLLKTNKATIERYIHLLEQSFIIYRLNPFSKNLRNELKKMRKIYFYDVGVRNALINAYGPLELRNDIGALWENFIISERIKQNENNLRYINKYFWRTHQQQEIDYLEEENMQLSAFEFKWNQKKIQKQAPKTFRDAYPNTPFEIITPKNYQKFVGLE